MRFFIIENSKGIFTGHFGNDIARLKYEFLFFQKRFHTWPEAEEYGYKIVELVRK